MALRFILDTHVIIRWLAQPKKLSREQTRILNGAVLRGEPVAISAISLLEIGVLFAEGSLRINTGADELLGVLEANPLLRILPLTTEIAAEVASLGRALRDPADRAIVSTARVHRLRLLTSDERIIQSKLLQVVD